MFPLEANGAGVAARLLLLGLEMCNEPKSVTTSWASEMVVSGMFIVMIIGPNIDFSYFEITGRKC